MNQAAQERLMRYVDGELDDEEVALVERWLSESAEARVLLGDLETIRGGIRSLADERGARSGDLTGAVMARIQRDQGVRRRRILGIVPAVGLGLAAAAAVVAFLRPHPGPGAAALETARVAVSQEPSMADPSTVALETAAADPDPGASIESVDFGSQNGAIFLIASGPEVTPVVWLTDDGDPTSG